MIDFNLIVEQTINSAESALLVELQGVFIQNKYETMSQVFGEIHNRLDANRVKCLALADELQVNVKAMVEDK